MDQTQAMQKSKTLLLPACVVALISILFTNCTPSEPPIEKNEVLVLGAIHGRHLTSEVYGVDQLADLIRAIKPDIVLTEIPPDRFDAAVNEYKTNDTITEARVVRFPEYVQVLFPLTKEMELEIIPTAGWTREMADSRSETLRNIREDSSRQEEWAEYRAAMDLADSLNQELGSRDDPYWIHTDRYDSIWELGYSVYNRLFNDEIGEGGWDNINAAHYGYIAQALDANTGVGKRVLITYGAGHKGWFMRELRKRDDIELLDMKPFLDQVYNK